MDKQSKKAKDPIQSLPCGRSLAWLKAREAERVSGGCAHGVLPTWRGTQTPDTCTEPVKF